ncbi:metal ABC transporter permease [Pseudonocardia sichuanensis]|uniref:Zinc/manganese transport system permease protein/manganese/iron transport system permease protein n=1 Tax=Pseudonocardia kunmingensis TaxID=630975 RepID=A0A543D9W7_9PSEU|nr:metal ABC transporter permease [Pseudonocardia kunmingensis]TQM06110.1 zinc/manganese transport system permease protein/manganese/iron transport system permease protein [Pseudonocardia kunmingensis]
MSVAGWLTEPLAYPFMQRACAATLAVGVAAPVAGVWATTRRLVYLTDAMSHAILAGVAAAALLGASLLVGGLVAAMAMALLVAVLVIHVRLSEDSAIGVAGQGLFALGIIGVSQSADPRALTHVLFGNPLTVTTADVIAELVVAGLVVLAVATSLPLLVATTFDPAHARTLGVRTGLVDTAVIVALGLVVVISLTTVGVLMALTLCIAPAAAARLLSLRIRRVLFLAAGLGVAAGLAGLMASYHLGLPAGPTVGVLAATEVALAALIRSAGTRFRHTGRVSPGERAAGPIHRSAGQR